MSKHMAAGISDPEPCNLQYIYFGSGQFDGQGSGHDYYGTLFMPPTGFVNNCDGGRSHTYCDYRQQ